MRTRRLGRSGYDVSEIGFGAWAIGGSWGPVDDAASMEALHAAVDAGVTFFDTADVYGDGHSERLLGKLRAERDEDLIIATKVGRRIEVDPDAYTYERLRDWVDRSRDNLGVDTLDLVQLHALGEEIYDRPAIWEALDRLVEDERIAHYGVSVESVVEGIAATRQPGVTSVQIVFNLFRMKPADEFFPVAQAADVGVIARVPLASGLLTGKFHAESTFHPEDHRHFNRMGEEFDVGETFAGIDFETGLEAVEELRRLVPADATMAQFALRWILMHDAVSTVIPGARSRRQVRVNTAAASLPPLDEATMARCREIYGTYAAPRVHRLW